MTTEEKLKHFLDVTTQSVNAKNAQVLDEYEKALEQGYEDHTQDALRKAQLQLRLSEESSARKKNTEVAKEQIHIREEVSLLQEELKQKLFIEVKDKLECYMGTREYQDYLTALIHKVKEYAGGEDVLIYIDPADSDKLNALSAVTNTTVEVSRYGFGGGIRAVIRSRKVLIDQSFETKLAEEEEAFVFHL